MQHPYELMMMDDRCETDPSTSTSTTTAGLSLPYLMATFQQSKGEMLEMLDQLNALCIDGSNYVLLGESMLVSLFSMMLDHMIEQGWDIRMQVRTEQFGPHVQVPRLIIEHCLKIFSDKEKQCVDIDAGAFVLCSSKVTEFRVHEIFQERPDHSMGLHEFLEHVTLRLPDGILVTPASLHGIALVDSKLQTVAYFPEKNLPLDLASRFEHMFAFRSSWTLEELRPYLRRFVAQTTTEESLLLKYTTAVSQVDGPVRYTAAAS